MCGWESYVRKKVLCVECAAHSTLTTQHSPLSLIDFASFHRRTAGDRQAAGAGHFPDAVRPDDVEERIDLLLGPDDFDHQIFQPDIDDLAFEDLHELQYFLPRAGWRGDLHERQIALDVIDPGEVQ